MIHQHLSHFTVFLKCYKIFLTKISGNWTALYITKTRYAFAIYAVKLPDIFFLYHLCFALQISWL